MDLQTYLQKASRTAPDSDHIEKTLMRLQDHDIVNFDHALEGITTECGELVDVMKKFKHYGKEIDWINVQEELGDLMWYVALLLSVIQNKTGITMDKILDNNIAKLEARYPEKFTYEKANQRNLENERKVLESVTDQVSNG